MDVNQFGGIVTVLSLLIIASNALVIVVLALMISKNRSASLYFILNLAVADMLVGFTCFGTAVIVLSRQSFATTGTLCILRISLLMSPSAASVLTMVSVAFDRFLAIKLPLRYCQLMTDKMVAMIIAGLWSIALLIGFLPAIIQQLKPDKYNNCNLFSVVNPNYIIVVFCSCFVPASLTVVYFYSVILKIAYSHTRQILESERVSSASSPATPPRCHIRDVKAVRTIGILVGCFMVAWAPFFIASVVQACCIECQLHIIIEDYLCLLGLSNSLMNPLIYSYWQRDVRVQLCQMCCRAKFRITQVLSFSCQREAGDIQNPGTERGDDNQLRGSCTAIGIASYQVTTNTFKGTSKHRGDLSNTVSANSSKTTGGISEQTSVSSPRSTSSIEALTLSFDFNGTGWFTDGHEPSELVVIEEWEETKMKTYNHSV